MVAGNKMRTILNIAVIEYKTLLKSTKMIILGMFAIFINIQIIMPLKNCAVLMDGKLSFLEPFTAIGNSGIVVLILPLFYLAMMADFPREDGIHRFYQIRCDKTVWVSGQMLFALMSSISLTVFVLVLSVILIMPNGKWDYNFSDAVRNYAAAYPERSGDYVVRLLPENLYNQMTLYKAVIHTFCFLILYFLFLSLVLLLSALLNKKMLGILADGIIIAAGAIACASRTAFMWFLPMSHTITWFHYTEYMRREIFPINGSYLYFAAINVCMVILCVLAGRRYQVF